MNRPADTLEQRIDTSLNRLPRWAPPADFAARLAAAAARQAGQPTVSPLLVQAGTLLRLLSDSALVVIASLAVAAFLAWGIPWNSLVQSTQLLGWASITALFVSAAWATRRALSRS
jgi:hypothetical protein